MHYNCGGTHRPDFLISAYISKDGSLAIIVNLLSIYIPNFTRPLSDTMAKAMKLDELGHI